MAEFSWFPSRNGPFSRVFARTCPPREDLYALGGCPRSSPWRNGPNRHYSSWCKPGIRLRRRFVTRLLRLPCSMSQRGGDPDPDGRGRRGDFTISVSIGGIPCAVYYLHASAQSLYPPPQKDTGLPLDECVSNCFATARCRPKAEVDNRVVAEGEDGCFGGTTGLPVGLHFLEPAKNASFLNWKLASAWMSFLGWAPCNGITVSETNPNINKIMVDFCLSRKHQAPHFLRDIHSCIPLPKAKKRGARSTPPAPRPLRPPSRRPMTRHLPPFPVPGFAG
jgi:hypothetical protein